MCGRKSDEKSPKRSGAGHKRKTGKERSRSSTGNPGSTEVRRTSEQNNGNSKSGGNWPRKQCNGRRIGKQKRTAAGKVWSKEKGNKNEARIAVATRKRPLQFFSINILGSIFRPCCPLKRRIFLPSLTRAPCLFASLF